MGIGAVARHYYKLLKDGKELQKNQETQVIRDDIRADIAALREELKQDITQRHEENKKQDQDIAAIKQGTLALWKKVYFDDCRRLLETGHIITYDEFNHISSEHDIYNQLGGNHEGDEMFANITHKYRTGLHNE